jgi:hypothetical protein
MSTLIASVITDLELLLYLTSVDCYQGPFFGPIYYTRVVALETKLGRTRHGRRVPFGASSHRIRRRSSPFCFPLPSTTSIPIGPHSLTPSRSLSLSLCHRLCRRRVIYLPLVLGDWRSFGRSAAWRRRHSLIFSANYLGAAASVSLGRHGGVHFDIRFLASAASAAYSTHPSWSPYEGRRPFTRGSRTSS